MTNSNTPNLLMSIDDAAKSLRLCRASVYKLINRGELRTAKIGRRVFINPDEARKFAERLRYTAKEAPNSAEAA